MSGTVFSINATASSITNLLFRRGIPFSNLHFEGNCVILTISSKQVQAAVKAFEEKRISFTLVKNDGFKGMVAYIKRKRATFFGCIIALICLLFVSTLTFSVRINDNSAVNEYELRALLDENQVKMPFVRNEDLLLLKKLLLARDGVSDVSVSKCGNVLHVEITEELPPRYIVDLTNKTPITAEENAVITRIICLGGTSQVRVGQVVAAGQVLIEPYVAVGEEKIETNAIGVVYGNVVYSKRIMLGEYVTKKRLTGETHTVNKVSLPVAAKKAQSVQIPFTQYQCVTKAIKCSALLPFWVENVNVYETETVTMRVDEDFIKNTAVPYAVNALKEQIATPYNQIDIKYFVQRIDKNTIIDVYYTVEKTINLGGNDYLQGGNRG